MNINRHNYEEFFLLYVDKELSAADRKVVDVFVTQNPDLQMELTLLQQTIMPADDTVLQKKDWLYMEEDISALQQNLLLYTDSELNVADKKAVELLLDTNATAKKELALLQQTKLQPDMAVVFEDKTLLYRKEDGSVVGLKWWRVAAAAVLLGFGLWTGVSVYKNNAQKANGSETSLVKETKIKPGQQKTAITVDPKQTIPTVKNTAAENSTATINQQSNTQTQPGEKNASAAEKINNADNQGIVASQQTIKQQNSNAKKPDNNLPLPERNRAGKPYLENINNQASNEAIVKNVQSENSNNQRVSGSNEAVVKINPKENKTTVADINNSKADPNLTAMQVVNTNTADDGENNSYLDVNNNKKRTAFGGFIRKAKRVLERTANVKTGEGIKIAGFEIALK